jgi:glycerol-3-phosphate cytidylyltransferase
MKKIITYGTYDLLHHGHVNLLRRAKELGDYLIVGLSTDEFNLLKNKKAVIPYNQRKEILEAIKYVDLVIPETDWEQKINDVHKYDIDVFVMGGDWEGKFDFLAEHCDVKYFPRTDAISTTLIKTSLKAKA